MRVLSRIIPYLVMMMIVTTACVIGLTTPVAYEIAVGGDRVSQLRYLDEPFIANFNPPEPAEWPTSEQPRRWSKSDWRISWPNAGQGWWISHISVNTTPRPADNPAQIEFTVPHMSGVVVPNAVRTLHLLTKSIDETPRVEARMNALAIAGDNRDLGIVVTHIGITSLGTIIRSQLMLALVLFGALFAVTLRVIMREYWWSGTSVLFVLLALSTYTHAEWWLVHTHTVIASTGIGLLLSAATMRWTNPHDRALLSVIGMSVVAQLILLNSPWLRSSDISMHVRMFNQVLTGDMLFTAQLPCEAGAQEAPYPVIAYLIAAPFGALLNERWWHIAVLQSGSIVLHSIALWYTGRILSREMSQPSQVVLIWGIFAASSPFLVRALHIGEISNTWAHALYLVAVMSWFDTRSDWRVRGGLSLLVLLSHTGITITYLATMLVFCAWKWREHRRVPLHDLLILTSSLAIGGMIYYSQFLTTTVAGVAVAGCPPNYPIAVRMSTVANDWAWPLFISGMVGLMIPASVRTRQWVMMGIGAAILSIALLLFRDQTVRWALAVTPFVALPASFILIGFMRRQRAGKIMALCVILLSIWMIYAMRWEYVRVYLHT